MRRALSLLSRVPLAACATPPPAALFSLAETLTRQGRSAEAGEQSERNADRGSRRARRSASCRGLRARQCCALAFAPMRHLAVGITNSAPLAIEPGQRCSTALYFV